MQNYALNCPKSVSAGTALAIQASPRGQRQRLAKKFVEVLGFTARATPAAPVITNQGTPGATTYTYEAVGITAGGDHTPASAAGSTTTGNSSLGVSNYNVVTAVIPGGCVSVDIYRTVGGGSTGKIGNVTGAGGKTVSLNDTGLSGDSGTAPSTNTTGAVATVAVEVTDDLTNWTRLATFTTNGATAIPRSAKKVRTNVTAYTSGTPTATLFVQPGLYRD